MIHQLIDARVDKAHELNFADGLEPLRGHADAQSADQEFGERRVDHALGTEALLQAGSGAEHAAIDADILAEHDDVRVVVHGAREREIDGFDQRRPQAWTLPFELIALRARIPREARHRDDRTWSPARRGAVAR